MLDVLEIFYLINDPVVKELEYDGVDRRGIPWGLTVRVDRTAFQDRGTFAEFAARTVPYSMRGRYQIVRGVPAGE